MLYNNISIFISINYMKYLFILLLSALMLQAPSYAQNISDSITNARSIKFDLFSISMPGMAPVKDVTKEGLDTIKIHLEVGEYFNAQIIQIKNIENFRFRKI